MQIWQRGTSFSSGYTADRWFIGYGTSPTFSQSTDVPSTGGFQYSMSVSGSGQPTLAQRIESLNCKDLGGATVTISFWAKLTSGSGNLYAFLVYPSAADNYTTVTTSSNYTFTPTSSWAYYTITIPSISSNAVNGLGLSITSVSTSSITFLITGVQLEVGSVATPFERRLYGQELALCQRYYQSFASTDVSVSAITTQAAVFVPFVVQMRTIPTATYPYSDSTYNSSPSSGQWCFNVGYVSNISKTGTITTAVTLLTTWAKIFFYGMTLSSVPTGIGSNNQSNITFSAEL